MCDFFVVQSEGGGANTFFFEVFTVFNFGPQDHLATTAQICFLWMVELDHINRTHTVFSTTPPPQTLTKKPVSHDSQSGGGVGQSEIQK